MGESGCLYELSEIKHGYSGFTLDIPEFRIHAGSAVGLSGPNGSGKSTLIRLLAFLEYPASGEVRFNSTGEKRMSVTMLQQDPYLLKRSVYDNVCYGLKARGDYSDLKKRVSEALETVNLNHEKFMHRKWHELSGGEAKRVALASRIILMPQALLLDEPVANVDAESSIAISAAIRRMRELHSTTLVISSHDLTWLNLVADTVWKLHDGKIAGSGSANIIPGPWTKEKQNLWRAALPGGEKIYATEPPSSDSIAILYPNEIIISEKKIADTSAINRLKAEIKLLASEGDPGKIRVELEASGKVLNAHITETSAKKMNIYPGKKIYILFKATSLVWQ